MRTKIVWADPAEYVYTHEELSYIARTKQLLQRTEQLRHDSKKIWRAVVSGMDGLKVSPIHGYRLVLHARYLLAQSKKELREIQSAYAEAIMEPPAAKERRKQMAIHFKASMSEQSFADLILPPVEKVCALGEGEG